MVCVSIVNLAFRLNSDINKTNMKFIYVLINFRVSSKTSIITIIIQIIYSVLRSILLIYFNCDKKAKNATQFTCT